MEAQGRSEQRSGIKSTVEQALTAKAAASKRKATPAAATVAATTKPLNASVAAALKATSVAQPQIAMAQVSRSPVFVANLAAATSRTAVAANVKSVPVVALNASAVAANVQKVELKRPIDLRLAGKLTPAQQVLVWNAINGSCRRSRSRRRPTASAFRSSIAASTSTGPG